MEVQAKHPGSIPPLLVGLVLLATVAGVVAAFFPLAKCPEHHFYVHHVADCPHCGGSERVSLLSCWFGNPTPEQRERLPFQLPEGEKSKLPEEKK
jgi:hypothetical protein